MTSSNWSKLRNKLAPSQLSTEKKHKHKALEDSNNTTAQIASNKSNRSNAAKYIGLDCEMVGVGSNGKVSALARCSIVNYDGNVLYDKYVRPKGFVTDFRTKYSGIRSKHLRKEVAIPFEQCQAEVAEILRNRILVGHALENDLGVLMLSHHPGSIRDTSRYRPFMKAIGVGGGKMRSRSLKDLSREFLGIEIQTAAHDSVEDARAAMSLFRLKQLEWESALRDAKSASRTRKPTDPLARASTHGISAPSLQSSGAGKRKSIFDPEVMERDWEGMAETVRRKRPRTS